MARRPSLWLKNRKPVTLRNTPSVRVGLSFLSLEDRITPDGGLAFLGPLMQDQISNMESLALPAYKTLSAMPDSPTGAETYFKLADYSAFSINTARLAQQLPTSATDPVTLAIPRPDGAYERFRVTKFQLLTDDFAAVRSDVSTFRGMSIDNPGATLVADLTPSGFRAMVLSPTGDYFIDPYYHLDSSVSVSYFKHDNLKDVGGCDCPACQGVVTDSGIGTFGMGGTPTTLGPSPVINLGANLRTFRLALAATAEYTAFWGGNVTTAQNGMITSINRVSGVYEKDLGVKLNLINNTSLIYTNSTTDPYTNNNGSTMLTENQNNITTVIGSANYDIGHVFSTGGGGVAGLGVVGSSTNKARGVTGSGSPTADSFDIDYVAHEMGHQFGGNHSFNTSQDGNRNGSTAWEPGSGSTIMSYAGIIGGGDDLQSNSDAYFHVGNIGEIRNFLNTIPSVGTTTASGNTVPVANAGPDYTIPGSTPFALTGSATETQGDPLTYTWEQYDIGAANTLATISAGNTTAGPVMRSLTGTSNPTRTIPRLSNLLANTTLLGEYLSNVTRTLNFTLTVKDTRAMTGPVGGVIGGISSDDMVVNVVNTGAAFTVTAPNTAVSLTGGATSTVTWNVAGTTANGINAANVAILLSTDGGNTFPTTLIASTPNDGSEAITIPNTPTSTARIKVQPVGNIFFDISNTNFTITPGSGMQVNSTSPTTGGVLAGPATTLDLVFSEPINVTTLQSTDLTVSAGTVTGVTMPNSTTARFTITGLSSEGTLTANMAAGAVISTTGNSTSAFSANYVVDFATTAVTALTPLAPAGSRVYSTTISGNSIGTAGDSDAFTIALDAGQTLSAFVTPGSTLNPNISITGPGTNSSASGGGTGRSALVNNVPITTAGTYTVTLSGLSSTTGTYSIQLLTNAVQEVESATGIGNNTPAAAQNLDSALRSLGGDGSFGALRGKFDGGSSAAEAEPNDVTLTATNVSNSFSAYTGNFYHLGIAGTLTDNTDYINIGALQAGDVITVAEYGSPGRPANGAADPLVYLYRGTSTQVINGTDTQYDDGGVGNDALIYRFTVTTADTYYIRGSRFNSGTTGSYDLGVLLENSGTAPTTGGTVFTETEANNTQATATNLANSWQAPQYISTSTGSLATSADIDTFAYTFNAGDLVTVMARSTGTADLKARLLNASGTVLFQEDGTSANTASGPGLDSYLYSYRIATTGTYYVDVQAVTGSGNYSLDVLLSSTVAPPTPIDYHAVTLAAGQTLNLTLEGQTAGTYALDIVNATNTVLAAGVAGSTNVDRSVTYTATGAGVVYARISGNNSADYVLGASLNAAQDLEPNDSFAASQALGVGGRAVGAITPGNDDWYTVDLTAGTLVTITTTTPFDGANLPANTLDPRLALYSPGNVLVASDSNSGTDGRNASLSYAVTASGPYRIQIGSDLASAGEYGITSSSVPNVLAVAGFTVNNAATQRSRLTSIEVTFTQNVNAGDFNGDGDITLTRYASTPAGSNGTVVKTGATGPNGLITVTQGSANVLILSFSNADASVQSAGVEYGSLADGRWRLAVTSAGYENPIGVGDPIIRRFFGDRDNSGQVDAIDLSLFGSTFGLSSGHPNYLAAFDFNGNGDIDSGTDLSQFGNRFGYTL